MLLSSFYIKPTCLVQVSELYSCYKPKVRETRAPSRIIQSHPSHVERHQWLKFWSVAGDQCVWHTALIVRLTGLTTRCVSKQSQTQQPYSTAVLTSICIFSAAGKQDKEWHVTWAWGRKDWWINHSGRYSWVPFSPSYTIHTPLTTSEEKQSARCNDLCN